MKIKGLFIAVLFSSLSLAGFSQQTTSLNNPEYNGESPASNVLIVRGKLIDKSSQKSITKANLKIREFSDGIINMQVDSTGSYLVALDKTKMDDTFKLIFKIKGYKKVVVANLDKSFSEIQMNVKLTSLESEEDGNASVKYVMSDNPFNPLVIKIQ